MHSSTRRTSNSVTHRQSGRARLVRNVFLTSSAQYTQTLRASQHMCPNSGRFVVLPIRLCATCAVHAIRVPTSTCGGQPRSEVAHFRSVIVGGWRSMLQRGFAVTRPLCRFPFVSEFQIILWQLCNALNGRYWFVWCVNLAFCMMHNVFAQQRPQLQWPQTQGEGQWGCLPPVSALRPTQRMWMLSRSPQCWKEGQQERLYESCVQ